MNGTRDLARVLNQIEIKAERRECQKGLIIFSEYMKHVFTTCKSELYSKKRQHAHEFRNLRNIVNTFILR